jgi:PTS system nitrogen regulatory IIA component
MELRIKDIVKLLEVSEKTVYRWIKERKIPCYRINHQYRFNRAEINEWILNNRISVVNPSIKTKEGGLTTDLAALIEQGGIHYNIEGHTVRDVLHNTVNAMTVPDTLSRNDLFFALLNREELMSTAAGNGIALPHSRTPLIAKVEDACVSIAFLKHPIDFKALDGKRVHTLFLILTYAPKRHLEVLSKISHLCQHKDFINLLKRREPEEAILKSVREYEEFWSEASRV